MRQKPFISFFICLFITVQVYTQSCLPEGITFLTQTQLDSFPINYQNCTEIEGSVIISGGDIKDLSGLNKIVRIMGNLSIYNNDSLESMAGLDNLVEVEGDLMIGTFSHPGGPNPMLSSLTGLDKLEEVGEDLWVSRNHVLQDFEGLGSLRMIGDRFICQGNHGLLSFSGMNILDSLGGSIDVEGNFSLQDFTGFERLSRVYGGLFLGTCYLGGGLNHGGNGNASFTGLHNIKTVDGPLNICQYEREDIIGLEKLSYVGGQLEIAMNANLQNLSGLDSIQFIGDGIRIGYIHDYIGVHGGNHSLNDITALIGVQSVGGGEIHIEDNPMLTSLSGLDSIEPATIGNVYVRRQNSLNGNGHLTWCSVKSICDYVDIYGAIYIFEDNCSAEGCNGISEVKENCVNNSIDDQEMTLAVELFPVPAYDKLNISISGEDKVTDIIIHDCMGRQTMHIDGYQSTIDVSGFNPGMYFITFNSDRKRLVRKFWVY